MEGRTQFCVPPYTSCASEQMKKVLMCLPPTCHHGHFYTLLNPLGNQDYIFIFLNTPYLESAEMEHPLNILNESHNPEDLDYAPFPRLSLRSALFLPSTEHRFCCPRRELRDHSVEASAIFLRSFPIWDRVGFEASGSGLV